VSRVIPSSRVGLLGEQDIVRLRLYGDQDIMSAHKHEANDRFSHTMVADSWDRLYT
jgi:hypothetical protein